eukprot:m51a1_g3829 hypothetical protein (821) ;mRNA; r:311391-314700
MEPFANFFIDPADKRHIPLHHGIPGRVHVPSVKKEFDARKIHLLLPHRFLLETDTNTGYSLRTFNHEEDHVYPDPAEEEALQRARYGPFFKRPLPRYGTGDKLFLLGRFGTSSEEPCTSATSGSVPLSTVISQALRRVPFSKNVASLVGKSGVGKTTAIIELAKQYFVVFTDCSIGKDLASDYAEAERLMTQMSVEVSDAVDAETGRPLEGWEKKKLAQKKFQDVANVIVAKRVLAKLLHLLLLLDEATEELEPITFFVDQLNGGSKVVDDFLAIINDDEKVCSRAVELVVAAVERISELTGRRGPVLAWDEIPSATNILRAAVLSSKVQTMETAEWWDAVHQRPRSNVERSFATSLLAALQFFGAPLVTAGTFVTVPIQDLIEPAVAKAECTVHVIVDFPSNDDPVGVLGEFFDLSRCTIKQEKASLLKGRFRFTALVIDTLQWNPEWGVDVKFKKRAINSAIDAAIEECRGRIVSDVDKLLDKDRALWIPKLSKIVLAWEVYGGVLEWAQARGDIDLFTNSLCAIVDDDKVSGLCRLRLSEPLAVAVISDKLEASGVEVSALHDHFRLLCDVLATLSPKSSCKGCVLDYIVRETLKLVVVGTAQELGYKEGCHGDIQFLLEPVRGAVLIPQNQTRQDGILALQSQRYFCTVANKYSCELVTPAMHKDNIASSDIRQSFTKDGKRGRNLEAMRDEFEDSGVPDKILGQLRIHVVIPGTNDKGLLKTRVEGDDVLVFVHQGNLDDFFWEELMLASYADLHFLSGHQQSAFSAPTRPSRTSGPLLHLEGRLVARLQPELPAPPDRSSGALLLSGSVCENID